MNGKRFLLDTNAIIEILRNNQSILSKVTNAEWIGISIISKIEFLAFSRLNQNDKNLFKIFLKRVEVLNITNNENNLIKSIIEIRKKYKVKLPDAVIAAKALIHNAILMTADKEFQKITDLNIYNFIE